MQYRAALFFVFRLIAHDRRDCLAVLDFSGIDHFTQLIDRICIDIDKFILVQMLMGRLQILRNINFDLFIAERNGRPQT